MPTTQRYIVQAKWFGDNKLCPRKSLRHEIIIDNVVDLEEAHRVFEETTAADSPQVGSGWTIDRFYLDVTDDWHGMMEDHARTAEIVGDGGN